MINDAITNYATFPPLGTILVVMLGVAVADRSGLLAAMLRAVGRGPLLGIVVAGWSGPCCSMSGGRWAFRSAPAPVRSIPLGPGARPLIPRPSLTPATPATPGRILIA
ncbi:AbgT family transporter [Streptomyces asiaticus]